MSLPDSRERSALEGLGDMIEAIARNSIDPVVVARDSSGNEVIVRNWLFAKAWDIKQMARTGTPSEGV